VDLPIKQEPGQTPVMPPPIPMPAASTYSAGPNPNAAARAIQRMQDNFGEKAAKSISSFGQQSHLAQGQPAARSGTGVQMTQAQYRAQVAAQMRAGLQQSPAVNGANSLGQSQNDGTVDDTATGPTRAEIDGMLHAQLAARAKQMEGGGLMVPLSKVHSHSAIDATLEAATAQVDGPDDNGVKGEDYDEDAINSDLDDPDEGEQDDDDDDDDTGRMLCMYDKVQRVKNKWYEECAHKKCDSCC
jgi:transcription initiation factor TFIIA large subunit